MGLTYIEACQRGAWHLQVWRRGSKRDSLRHIPFRCRSWRHEGPCREWCGACDYDRCLEAIQTNCHWTYLVLTYPGGIRAHATELFRWGVRHWSKLRKRITHEFGPMAYIQTWEVHKSGIPHVNVLISNQAFFFAAKDTHRWLKVKWLEPALVEVGFGPISWLEPMRSQTRMAGYLTKLARELTGAGVKNQVPINAPRHFRRIRASRGLLPKRYKDPETTGRLVKMSVEMAQKPTVCNTVNEYPLELQEQADLQFPKIRT